MIIGFKVCKQLCLHAVENILSDSTDIPAIDEYFLDRKIWK